MANLRDSNPDYLSEWHPQLNEGISPSDVSLKSNKKYWWRCSSGHDFLMSPDKRAIGQGCPKCSVEKRVKTAAENRLASRGSLADNFPNVSNYWHMQLNGNITPAQVTASSAKKFWWQCDLGHTYLASPANRTRGRACPTCARVTANQTYISTIIKTRGSLSSRYPELLESWDQIKNGNIDPGQIPAHGDRVVWWKCGRGHSWSTQVKQRTAQGSGCPDCRPNTSRLEIRIYAEFKVLFPNTIWRTKIEGFEADIVCPELKLAIEIDGYPWHLGREDFEERKGNIFRSSGLSLIQVRDRRLSISKGHSVMYTEGENSTQTVTALMRLISRITDPETSVIFKLDQWLSAGVFVGDEIFNKILSYLPGPSPEDSFGTLMPEIASQWDDARNFPLTPYLFHLKSNQKFWWTCLEGHSYQMALNKRAVGQGCPFCAGRRVNSSNSLAMLKPQLAEHWNDLLNAPLTPNDVTVSSNQKVWWTCDNGHSWKALISKRKDDIDSKECPECSSLFFRFPELAKEFVLDLNLNIDAKFVSAYSNQKVWWRCALGHEWLTTINSRAASGTGCAKCKSSS